MEYAFLQAGVQLNFLPMCICVFLIYFLVINHPFERALTKRFYPLVILLFLLIVIDNLDYYCIDSCNTGIFHKLVAMLGYDIRMLISASFIGIAIEHINHEKSRWIYIPCIINVLLILPCLFAKLVFDYEPGTCRIIRGPLAFVPHIIFALYILILLYYSTRIIFYNRISESIMLYICSTLCVLAVLVEMIYQLRGILVGVIAFNMMFYYMYLHIEHFKYDTLTSAFNKESFMADVEKFGKHYITALMSIDMNDLKIINDSKGHLEGDKAIKKTANVIQRNLISGSFLYRVGGDEFVIICTKVNYKLAKDLENKIKEELKKADIVCAVGSSEWKEGQTFEEVYKDADKAMYEDKRALKEGLNA